ncbi:DsbA family oxidoreductase [Archangium violaceum]|uniref:DsbA family oxidoreductase n=1 Tax=Archangium violaceum TaxID=83451 RepID=UPI0031B887EB
MQEEYDVEVEWKGFELNPETPRGGISLDQLFPGRGEAMRAHAEQFGRSFGVSLKVPARMSNTRRVLAVTEWAKDQGRFQAFHQAAMEAYWRRGEDLESPDVLARLAEQAGLPGEGARGAMDSPEYQARLDTLRDEARRDSVRGIPTFFIGKTRVVGCQPYEAFEQAVQLAGARRRQ